MNPRKLAVIDYGTGNSRSVVKAFEFLNTTVTLAQNRKILMACRCDCLSRQGSFDQCINSIKESGLIKHLRAWILQDRPFFGICLGLQVLFGSSEEGKLPGLGIFNGSVVRFSLDSQYKVLTWVGIK